ncbi:MAG: protoheme IX farnesyltransferase, partial [Euryarchaeota archaeon]|nr:protoheme IX farnesyltransferase [Euryarchaeota archaeon]
VPAGEAATRHHVTAYAVILLLTSLGAGWLAGLDWPYLVAAVLLGGRFLQLALALQRVPSEQAAWAVFGYSNVYLFLFFAAMIIDIAYTS